MFRSDAIVHRSDDYMFDKIYQVIHTFKCKYELRVRLISSDGNNNDKLYVKFSVNDGTMKYEIDFGISDKKVYITLFDDGGIDDFVEKYTYLKEMTVEIFK